MQILLLGDPLDGAVWDAPEPPPPFYYPGSFGNDGKTIYELRRFPGRAIELAYVATTLTADEAQKRLDSHSNRAP